MKNLLIIVSLIAFAHSRVSNCAVDLETDNNKCLVCHPKFKLNEEKTECNEIIAHCLVYSNKQFTSCDYCEQGFSLEKQQNDVYICKANFEGEQKTVCKPGYIKSGNGFCFFAISNCIKYSTKDFDNNGNPLCETCFTSNGDEIDENSPYVADYIVSLDQTHCIPKIKGCLTQVGNRCVKSNTNRPLAGEGRWVCTKCKAGEIFQIDRCAPAVAPPCTEKPGYVLVGQPNGQSICLKTPDSLRDHCIEYDDYGECKKCKPAITSSCTKNEFNVYDKACWPQHQKSVNYILVQNTCVKEIMHCFEQDLNQNCLKCNFGYALINSAKNCARNHQYDLNLFTPKMTFEKIFARNTQTLYDNTNKRYWEDKKLATKTNIFSQKDDFLEAVSQTHTYIKGEVQNPWDGKSRSYKTKVLLAGDENPVVVLQDENTVSFHAVKEYPLNEWLFATPVPNTFIKKVEQSPF